MLCQYPTPNQNLINPTIDEEIDWLKKVIISIRTIRSEMLVNPSKCTPLYFNNATPEIKERINKYSAILMSLGKVTTIHLLNADDPIPLSSSDLVSDLELLIPMAGVIDPVSELQRLEKEIIKIEKEIIFNSNKLSNKSLTENAPHEVIQKTQTQLAQDNLIKQKLFLYKEKITNLIENNSLQ